MSVGLVLSGGGARGAYEVGVLSALLPALQERGEQVEVVVGTSVGAFNAAYVGASVDRALDDALAEAIRTWSSMRYRDVLGPLVGPWAIARGLRFFGQLLGLRRPRVDALLNPRPLGGTLERMVKFDELAENTGAGRVRTAVVATSALTSRTVIFHAGTGDPKDNPRHGIKYVRVERLEPYHVLASGSIPGIFPATRVLDPEEARGYYYDGGTRLNTPIQPALDLGATKVIVIGLNSIATPAGPIASDERPDAFLGSAQISQALLVDPLIDDIRRLGERNARGDRQIPYVFVAPETPDAIGRIAREVFNTRYAGPLNLIRRFNLSLLGRTVAAGDDALHGELFSVLLFDPVFLSRLIELGRENGQRWVDEHKEDFWETKPLPDLTAR